MVEEGIFYCRYNSRKGQGISPNRLFPLFLFYFFLLWCLNAELQLRGMISRGATGRYLLIHW